MNLEQPPKVVNKKTFSTTRLILTHALVYLKFLILHKHTDLNKKKRTGHTICR